MDRSALHLEIRNALVIADELARHEHALGKDELAGSLSALRSALCDLEREVGRSHDAPMSPDPAVVEAVERALGSLVIRRREVPRHLRARSEELLGSAERVSIALWDPDERVPSKPLLGRLPLARVVPQDVHTGLDGLHAAGFALSAVVARTARGRAVGAALSASLLGVSAVTDCRISAAKVVPVETHEGVDHLTALAAIAAPFVLGYARKDPVAALLHVGLGVGHLVTSLLTDYRAHHGLTLPVRSKGGPAEERLPVTVRLPEIGAPQHSESSREVAAGEIRMPLDGATERA